MPARVSSAGRRAAEVGLDHLSGCGAPRRAGRRRSACRTRARRSGRRCSSTRPMSWSISSMELPCVGQARAAARPSSSLSPVSRPAAGSSRHSRRGLHRDRARDAHELALALREVRRHQASAAHSSSTQARAPRSTDASLGDVGLRTAPAAPATRMAGATATLRFSRTRQVVEQLAALPRAGETAARALVGREAPARSRPSSSHPARVADEAA